MRNVFDQFREPENRLTHALMTSLGEEPELLRKFLFWATGSRPPKRQLFVQEQSLPGELEEAEEPEERERRGLPDGCIHDGETWALAIESKIVCPLESDQLRRHRTTIERLGFTDVHLLALVVKEPNRCAVDGLAVKRWADIYLWLSFQKQSAWATRLREYMEVMEAKLPKEQYLRDGTLTVFSGINFGKEIPYNYLEAKRILRLLMGELRTNKLLHKELGVDALAEGRGAITGKDSDAVWDYLPISEAAQATTFTQYPHLAVGVHSNFVQALVVVPNGILPSLRRALIDGGPEAFFELFHSVLERYRDDIGDEAGVCPIVEAVQRRYRSQRSEPFMDTRITFDLRTAYGDGFGSDASPRNQPQWLQAVFEALSHKRSNLQLAVGVRFDYNLCSYTQSPDIARRLAESWIICKPIIAKMLSSRL